MGGLGLFFLGMSVSPGEDVVRELSERASQVLQQALPRPQAVWMLKSLFCRAIASSSESEDA